MRTHMVTWRNAACAYVEWGGPHEKPHAYRAHALSLLRNSLQRRHDHALAAVHEILKEARTRAGASEGRRAKPGNGRSAAAERCRGRHCSRLRTSSSRGGRGTLPLRAGRPEPQREELRVEAATPLGRRRATAAVAAAVASGRLRVRNHASGRATRDWHWRLYICI